MYDTPQDVTRGVPWVLLQLGRVQKAAFELVYKIILFHVTLPKLHYLPYSKDQIQQPVISFIVHGRFTEKFS